MFIVTIFLCSWFLSSSVHSFDAGWTTNIFASEDATHYSMTECALLQLTADYMRAVYNITTMHSVIKVQNGLCQTKSIYTTINAALNRLKIDTERLKSAIKIISQTNTRTDLIEALTAATHFDSEQFDDGAMLISQRLNAAVASVKKEEYQQARESFGALLHTVQDFYSHSNWIEIGHREPNKGIGRYEILGKYATRGMRTCVDCEGDSCKTNIDPSIIENNILTTGFFGLKIIGANKPIGKCSHGGSSDKTLLTDARGDGINKDTLKSSHGHLHKIAASVAYNATKQILEEFWTMIGKESFGEFLGVSNNLRSLSANSLIIVMDDTGSMEPYIQMAKQIATGIVDAHQALKYKPSNYILSPFNDPTWGPLTISKTPEEFTTEISKLNAYDGGDGSELYYRGVVEALKVCEVGSFMYTFTDAPAKDAYLKSTAIQLAKEKRVTITSFYAKNSLQKQQAGRIFDRTGDVIEQLDISDGSDLPSRTGGVTMGVNTLALSATKDYILQRLDADKLQTILFAKGKEMNLLFYVDVSMESLHIEVTSISSLSPTALRLITPAGEELLPEPTSQTSFIRMYTVPIERHKIGQWTLVSQMTVEHIVQLNAMSTVSCSSTLQEEIDGSSSNMNFVPLINQPIKGETHLLVLTVCESLPSDLKTGYVNLVDASDASRILAKLSPIRSSPTGFLSKITVPSDDFRLSTVVHLQDDSTIQRQEKQIISPTSISLTIDDQPYSVVLNEHLVMNYTIYNHGRSELTITLRVIDTLGLLPASGILKSYKIAGLDNFRDTMEVNTIGFSGLNSNSTVATDSIVFSIDTAGYEYDQAVPLYILREKVHLTDQTYYQVPPKVVGAAKRVDISLISFVLFLAAFFELSIN